MCERKRRGYVWTQGKAEIAEARGLQRRIDISWSVWNDSGHPVLLEQSCIALVQSRAHELPADGCMRVFGQPQRTAISPCACLGYRDSINLQLPMDDADSAIEICLWVEFRYEGEVCQSEPVSIKFEADGETPFKWGDVEAYGASPDPLPPDRF